MMCFFLKKKKKTSLWLEFLLFINSKYNVILYKYISFHDNMKNIYNTVAVSNGGNLKINK